MVRMRRLLRVSSYLLLKLNVLSAPVLSLLIKSLLIKSLLILSVLSGCATRQALLYQRSPEVLQYLREFPPRFLHSRFIVLSDPHIYDPSLGISGPAFQRRLKGTPLLLVESLEIFREATEEIVPEKPDFVLVCGDLTNDGERVSHERLAHLLMEIEQRGVPVYVVPGNHDIDNPSAARYTDERRVPVESISQEEFARVYRDFGYGEAKYRDPSSLSYVTEPVEGLWLVGIDSCRYREKGSESTYPKGGRIYPQTIRWLARVFLEAVREGKAVVGFTHHGILEHFRGQRRYASDYLIQDNEQVARFLAFHSMHLIFTGHMHAQDVVIRGWTRDNEVRSLVDVETGSLSSFPCPYRIVELCPGRPQNFGAQPAAGTSVSQMLRIRTSYITSIASRREGFSRYAYERSYEATHETMSRRLKKLWLSDESTRLLSEWLSLTAMAHFMGDEREERNPVELSRLGFWAEFVTRAAGDLIEGLWNDPEPADNNLVLELDSTAAR
jgi:hypothetical protein